MASGKDLNASFFFNITNPKHAARAGKACRAALKCRTRSRVKRSFYSMEEIINTKRWAGARNTLTRKLGDNV